MHGVVVSSVQSDASREKDSWESLKRIEEPQPATPAEVPLRLAFRSEFIQDDEARAAGRLCRWILQSRRPPVSNRDGPFIGVSGGDGRLRSFARQFAERPPKLIDAVAFRKLDQRLAAALLGRGQDIGITHQQLADELGTVREIVTRLLRRFEREGWVELAREHIHIIDSAALRTMAAALQA